VGDTHNGGGDARPPAHLHAQTDSTFPNRTHPQSKNSRQKPHYVSSKNVPGKASPRQGEPRDRQKSIWPIRFVWYQDMIILVPFPPPPLRLGLFFLHLTQGDQEVGRSAILQQDPNMHLGRTRPHLSQQRVPIRCFVCCNVLRLSSMARRRANVKLLSPLSGYSLHSSLPLAC